MSGLAAFLKKAAEDEGLRKELAELAERYGVPLGTDELSDAALNQVAGGALLVSRTQRISWPAPKPPL